MNDRINLPYGVGLDLMTSILSVGGILVAFFQLLSYLIVKSKYNNMHVVEGAITHSKLDNYNDVDGKRVFQANIEIEYKFNGRTYISASPVLRSFEFSPSHNFENNLVERYQAGEVVNVRLNENYPASGYIVIAPLSVVSSAGVSLAAIIGVAYLGYVNLVLLE